MSDLTTLKMSDETISQIARLLQVAILSGTDVVDNLICYYGQQVSTAYGQYRYVSD